MKKPVIIFVLSILILESCFVNGYVLGNKYIFIKTFPLYQLFDIDYWWHFGLFLNLLYFCYPKEGLVNYIATKFAQLIRSLDHV